MRSQYEDFATVSDNDEQAKNSAIPYHARENSLPFSYGQINRTSTPLRNGSGGGGGGVSPYYRSSSVKDTPSRHLDFDFGSASATDVNYNLNSERSDRAYGNLYGRTTSKLATDLGTDANMIKAQPRLTSPLLVRKTLNSRSPTRNTGTTNTIANTYHYNYNGGGGSSSGGNGNGIGSAGLNGNINNSSYSSHNNNNYSSGSGSGSTLRKSTPTRNDFEELLRERREKVYNEYRSTTHDLQSLSSPSTTRQQPLPPPRQQYSTDAAARIANGHGPSRPNPGKYNFDFEFNLSNLNLDETPYPPPRRANTMERSSLQYRTRDIPREAHVERNYHTISSSNAIRETASYANQLQQQQQQKQQQQHLQQQQQQQQQERERPPLEAMAYNRRLQSPQQRPEYATYGRDLSSSSAPIYATTTKKQVATNSSSSSSTMYRNAIEPELSNTVFYPAAAAAASSSLSTTGMASTSATLVSRPETPAFPLTPRTPYGANNGYNSPNSHPHSQMPQRLDYTDGQSPEVQKYSTETIYQMNYRPQNQTQTRPRLNSNLSLGNSSEPQEVAAHLVKFAKDSSKFWYKPNLSREEAISLLLNAAPGTFVVRDSTTYKNAFGLVVRVAQPPPGSSSGKLDELVRHFLIEPTTRGVRLKGCADEPVFTSLSALVYEHSINQLALPCLLHIPEQDLVPPLLEPTPAQKQLITQGAACNVLWLYSSEMESLTGEEAIRKAIRQLYAQKTPVVPTEVHFKVSQQGITLTDNTRKKFFRKHYAADIISFCAIDPDHRLWSGSGADDSTGGLKKTIFAFVARRSPSSKDNQCHVFCDLAISQPASAIVSFVNKTLPTEKQRNYVL